MSFLPAPILVVDDDPDTRNVLVTYLSAEGHTVVEADSGEKALEVIAQGRVAMVLLDVMLPGLSGFDVCRRIKRDPKTSGTPVIMVTALGDTQSRTRAFESDADEFLAKPVFGPELIARVRSILRLRRVQLDKEAARSWRWRPRSATACRRCSSVTCRRTWWSTCWRCRTPSARRCCTSAAAWSAR